MSFLQRYTSDLFSLLFPELCNACGVSLYMGEKDLCTKCLADLPFTDFHLNTDNPAARLLWGRVPIAAITSLFYFSKHTKVQNMMHQLKYNGKTELGVKMGQMLGKQLKLSNFFGDLTVIVPVPLHERKLRVRGYNQSECIARGIEQELGLELWPDLLTRVKATASQTKKNRYRRYENMKEVFCVDKQKDLSSQHILLVDDVITTGATLEACALSLLENGLKKLSIATIAFAQ